MVRREKTDSLILSAYKDMMKLMVSITFAVKEDHYFVVNVQYIQYNISISAASSQEQISMHLCQRSFYKVLYRIKQE